MSPTILDLDRYRQTDHKISRVFTLERWRHLTFVVAPRQPGRLVFDFVGTFECVVLDDRTTRVTHAYDFTFRRPFRWIEQRLAEPLRQEIKDEVSRLAEIVSGESTLPPV